MQKNIPGELITYLILHSMEEKPTYGYEIIKDVKALSGGRWDLSYGTVYGNIKKLEKNGIIKPAKKDGTDRHYFSLTKKGRETLAKKKGDMGIQGEKFKDRVIGFLNVYKTVYGEEELGKLLKEIRKEFK